MTAAEGEVIVGQLAVHKRPVLIDGETEVIGIIGLVAVAHTHRRRGVAANMLVKAHDYLRSKGIAYSILFAVSEKYYTGAGYRAMETRRRSLRMARAKRLSIAGNGAEPVGKALGGAAPGSARRGSVGYLHIPSRHQHFIYASRRTGLFHHHRSQFR